MACERYFELLSARLDGALTRDEERELEEHLLNCPGCRAVGAQLSALQAGFGELEEVPAPEGFTQSVMDHIRAEEPNKVVPLLKRPQFRALAGLAACLVLAAGIYSAARSQDQENMMLKNRSFQHDVLVEEPASSARSGDGSAQESLCGDGDSPQVNASLAGPEDGEVPQIAAYAAPSPAQSDTSAGTEGIAPEVFGSGRAEDLQKAAPNSSTDGLTGDWALAEITLILDRLPQGAEDILPSDAAVVYDAEAGGDVYTWLTTEELSAIEKLAFEQGLIAGTTDVFPSPVGARCALIVRNG